MVYKEMQKKGDREISLVSYTLQNVKGNRGKKSAYFIKERQK